MQLGHSNVRVLLSAQIISQKVRRQPLAIKEWHLTHLTHWNWLWPYSPLHIWKTVSVTPLVSVTQMECLLKQTHPSLTMKEKKYNAPLCPPWKQSRFYKILDALAHFHLLQQLFYFFNDRSADACRSVSVAFLSTLFLPGCCHSVHLVKRPIKRVFVFKNVLVYLVCCVNKSSAPQKIQLWHLNCVMPSVLVVFEYASKQFCSLLGNLWVLALRCRLDYNLRLCQDVF